jgi:hypothetical protein
MLGEKSKIIYWDEGLGVREKMEIRKFLVFSTVPTIWFAPVVRL